MDTSEDGKDAFVKIKFTFMVKVANISVLWEIVLKLLTTLIWQKRHNDQCIAVVGDIRPRTCWEGSWGCARWWARPTAPAPRSACPRWWPTWTSCGPRYGRSNSIRTLPKISQYLNTSTPFSVSRRCLYWKWKFLFVSLLHSCWTFKVNIQRLKGNISQSVKSGLCCLKLCSCQSWEIKPRYSQSKFLVKPIKQARSTG